MHIHQPCYLHLWSWSHYYCCIVSHPKLLEYVMLTIVQPTQSAGCLHYPKWYFPLDGVAQSGDWVFLCTCIKSANPGFNNKFLSGHSVVHCHYIDNWYGFHHKFLFGVLFKLLNLCIVDLTKIHTMTMYESTYEYMLMLSCKYLLSHLLSAH